MPIRKSERILPIARYQQIRYPVPALKEPQTNRTIVGSATAPLACVNTAALGDRTAQIRAVTIQEQTNDVLV